MKKIVLIFIAAIIMFGCKEKSKIEIVKDIDREYKPVGMVSKIARPLDKSKAFHFESVIQEIHQKENPNEDVLYPLYLRFYINENGSIDKIKILSNNLDVKARRNPNPKYKEKVYQNPRKIVEKALPELEKTKFTLAKFNGKNTKTRADIQLIYLAKKTGEVELDKDKMKQEYAKSDFDEIDGIFFVSVEKMPEPIGGIRAIQKNIKYPTEAKKAGIEGRVYVKAYVDSTGTVVKTKIIRGINHGCDEVAEEAVKKVKFLPGRQRGKAVNVQVTIPILFKLSDGSNGERNQKKKRDYL